MLTAHCICCGESITLNPTNPFCHICGGVCSSINRESILDADYVFCHNCGKPGYLSPEKPFCDACQKKLGKVLRKE